MSREPRGSVRSTPQDRIREGWDAIAETWDSWAPTVDAWFAPATSALIEGLHLKLGDRVLELAAGSGGLTLHLARTVGPEGRVIATDSGPNMVKLAARNARAAGLSNVTARVMNGEQPDLSWASIDAIACRQGFMFFADPAGALLRLFRILRPGGRIGVTVFSSPEHNEFMTTPQSILSRHAKVDDVAFAPGKPGPFSLSEPDRLASHLREAGFVEIDTRIVSCHLRTSSVEDLVRFYRDILEDMVTDLAPEAQTAAWREVAEATAKFVRAGSPGAPSELIVSYGTRPSPNQNVRALSGS